MRVGFLGRGETGLAVLKAILSQEYTVPFVWTCRHTSEVGASPEEFERVADEHDIPFEFVESVNDETYMERLDDADLDIAVTIFWMDKIVAEVLERAEHGFLNLHGGALPRYRGNAAGNWAILENEDRMGITVHRMTPKLDSGPILGQEFVPITPETTVKDLVEATREVGAHIILDILESYRRGNPVPATPQNEAEALRCYPRIPEYGRVDWTQSAAQIDRHIRSLGDPYPPAFTYQNLQRIELLEARPETHDRPFLAEPGHIIHTEPDGEIEVATGDGVLVLEKIRLEGSDPIPPGAEFTSIRQRFGIHIEEHIRTLTERMNELEQRIESSEDE
jgi:methionyl-tRNA formyltransferase